MSEYPVRGLLGGLGVGLITVAVALLIPKELAYTIVCVLLAVIAAIYIGFALAEGERSSVVVETAAGAVFVGLSVLSLAGVAAALPFGYIAHGFWDAVHHPRGLRLRVPRWYPPFCLVYDWLVGGFALVYFLG